MVGIFGTQTTQMELIFTDHCTQNNNSAKTICGHMFNLRYLRAK